MRSDDEVSTDTKSCTAPSFLQPRGQRSSAPLAGRHPSVAASPWTAPSTPAQSGRHLPLSFRDTNSNVRGQSKVSLVKTFHKLVEATVLHISVIFLFSVHATAANNKH